MILFFALATGCVAGPRAIDQKPLEARAGIVFMIHGIWPDGWWVPEAERAFREAGIETVPVDYTSGFVGFTFGFGTDPPTERMLALVRALEARHARTGCAAPLRYHAVGYSGGT